MIKFFLLFVLMIFGIVFLLGGLTVFKVLRRIQESNNSLTTPEDMGNKAIERLTATMLTAIALTTTALITLKA